VLVLPLQDIHANALLPSPSLTPPSPLLPPVHRPRIKSALALLPKFIKTLNCGAWTGLAFISVAAVPSLPRKVPCVRKPGLGLHPIPSLYHSQKESPTIFLFGSHRLFLFSPNPHQPSTPISVDSFNPLRVLLSLSPLPLLSSSHRPTLPPFPSRGNNIKFCFR
jgi:hypothetical protein